ncbi:MlaC/ttg2D family ABC transporter substrate-binding protein [Galenea microaerophila]
MKRILLSCLFGWGLIVSTVNATADVQVDQTDPVKLVQTLSQTVITQLNAQREELSNHPQKIKAFANQYILPYVDTEKMARYVMGRYWRIATPAQQKAFVHEFTVTLLRSYANSMLNLKIKSFEVTGVSPEGSRGDRVIVSSQVVQADGNVSKVQYRAFQDRKTHLWKLYDVVIEGVSMLLNYRKTYATAFQQKGIEGVISEMCAKNKEFE